MTKEHNKTDDQIIDEQRLFFERNLTGCAFAAHAAKDPAKYEWSQKIVRPTQYGMLDDLIKAAIAEPLVSTLELIFPEIESDAELDAFISKMPSALIFLHQILDTSKRRCFRFRAQIGEEQSYISGFGPFEYMPVTRQSPYTSIVIRVKPRPDYDWFLKEPEAGLVHIADMDMKGMPDRTLRRMWKNSFWRVAGLLGKAPDEESAAKTTFAIPLARACQILI